MKISVSNIAWGKKNFDDFIHLIKENECDGIELAPSLIWDEPINSNHNERSSLKKKIRKSNLEFLGFHSLLFTRPDLQLFKDKKTRQQTLNYLKKIIDLCSDLEGKQIIFGSPNNRSLLGKSYNLCLKQFLDDINEITNYCSKKNVIFCIEPLGKNYTDFIVSNEEGGEIVKKIDNKYFKLHLDTKTFFFTKENPMTIVEKYKDFLQHVHISDENLQRPGSINNKKEHQPIVNALKKIKYDKYLSIEMKKDKISSIVEGISFVKNNYILN
jgi:D-psicose/D-tagatose/L-ribulose 3-epimerase